jgi:hypothetical protein
MSTAAEDVLKDQCAESLLLANICVQITPGCEECFNTLTFRDAFPRDISYQFLSAMAFVPQTNTGFCEVARERVCENYETNQSCCCQAETAAYRKCAFNKVLMPQVGWLEGQCNDRCEESIEAKASDDSGGGGSMGGIAAVIVVILFLVGATAGIIVYRRKKVRKSGLPTTVHVKNKEGDESDATHIANSSQGDEEIVTDVEAPSPRTGRKVSNMAEGDDDSSTVSEADFEYPAAPVNAKRVLREPASEDDEEPRMVRKSSKSDLLKEKRKAIEAWNAEKKQGSQRSLSSFIPDNDLDGKKDTVPIMPRSSSNRELGFSSFPDAPRSSSDIRKERREVEAMIHQLKGTLQEGLVERVDPLKKHTIEGEEVNGLSSRQMNKLMKDRAESTLRLSQLENTLKQYQNRMQALEDEAKVVRKERKSKDAAKLSMSMSALNIDDDLVERKMKKDRSLARSYSDPSLEEERVKKQSSSSNVSRQKRDPSPKENRVKKSRPA